MELEHLEKIAEILSTMGDQALLGLSIYVGLAFAGKVLGFATAILIVWIIAKYLASIIGDMSASYTWARSLRDRLNIGTAGSLNSGELRAVQRKVEEALEKMKEEDE